MKSSIEIAKFYDHYTLHQVKTGVNLRHLNLFNALVKAGLKKNHRVLEVGCGVGTLTGLLSRFLRRGKLVAADISSESIEVAKRNIKDSKRIDFIVTDMSDFAYPSEFDFIILPDVLEHIPLPEHERLFNTLSFYMHEDSLLIINIPHPKIIEYYQLRYPEKLQVVDQALSADDLMRNAYTNDLILVSYESYTVFHKEPDYVLIKFRKNVDKSFISMPVYKIIARKFVCRVKYILAVLLS